MAAINRDATATIANGASLSGAINLGAGTPVAIQMPAAWTAANLTFQGSLDNVTYQNIFDSSGVEVLVSAAAATYITLAPDAFTGFIFVKVRSGTSGVPVNQGASRAVVVINRILGYGGG